MRFWFTVPISRVDTGCANTFEVCVRVRVCVRASHGMVTLNCFDDCCRFTLEELAWCCRWFAEARWDAGESQRGGLEW